jgi:proline iminopeptidase
MLAQVATAVLPPEPARSQQRGQALVVSERRVSVDGNSLYARAIGQGPPVIVLHGGPDFDHRYFLPDLDRLGDSYRLIYYDQRGRGQSAANVRPEEVSLTSDIDDLDRVRAHFGIEAPLLLGHSWGAVLALEYALRHQARVSGLILMNPAPVSAADVAEFRKAYLEKLGPDMERQRAIVASAAYQSGDPAAVAARYRIHFRPAFNAVEGFERLMAAMRDAFFGQGSDGILKARAVEEQLMRDTWQVPGYDLLPKLRTLRVPTLVLASDQDFIPVKLAEHIAQAIPDAKLVTLKDCGQRELFFNLHYVVIIDTFSIL